MTKAIVITMLAGAQLTGALTAPAEAEPMPCTWHHTIAGNRATVRCFAHKFGVSSDMALRIAGRESAFDEWAYNPSSAALGLFQHLQRYWYGRVRMAHDALRRYHVHSLAWHNPRANAVVTMVYVRRYGWGAWAT